MLVNAKEMLDKALEGHYAVPHFNINNLEWTKAVLLACEEVKSPVILGVSEGAGKYMCGFETVTAMVKAMDKSLGITVPVALHLDHGSYDGCLACIKAGFTSIMFDGSHFGIEENVEKTKELVATAHKAGMSIEAEVGAIGNIHGIYPENWQGLSFETLAAIKAAIGENLPLVLHGGSGIPDDQIKKAISLGVSKINVNTELQLVFAKATREYIEAGSDKKGKGYDPRKLLKPGFDAIIEECKAKIALFGCANKA